MKKLVVLLLAVSLVLSLASCGLFSTPECTEHTDSDNNGKCDVCNDPIVADEPCTEHVDNDGNGKCDECDATVEAPVDGDEVMTYAEFVAAELNSKVTVITYVQAKQGWWNNKGVDVASFYTEAQDGAYFLYDMPCSEAEYNALVPGTCIKVTGYKAEWSGEVEIIDASFEILSDKAAYVANAKDITAAVAGGQSIIADQNKLIGLSNAVVAKAPMYKWDGSGSEGDDIYLTVAIGGETVTLVVESYLHGNGSEVYETVEALEVGDVIAVEAFLYWYNGAQPHINKVTKLDVMSYADFTAADLNTQVTVITYVQAKQGWWNNKGVDVASFYTQSQDGAYFLYDMPCTEAEYNALVPGTCIKVTGYKAEWSGEVEIIDATFEIIDDLTYIAKAEDITVDIYNGKDLAAKQNFLVAIDAIVWEAPMYKWDGSGSEGDDIYLTVVIGGETITLVVESYLHGNGSEVYETVEALEVGDVIAVEAFLYWYNGAQPHINKAENLDVMNYDEFLAADLNSEVTVITYVQAKQGWWNNKGVDVASFYAQSYDGAYFLYDMPCTEAEYNALVPGTCIKVTGYKAEWSGEVEIIDATFEILDKKAYVAEAADISDVIAAGVDISPAQNALVGISGVVSAAPMYKWDGSGSEGDDIYLDVTVGEVTMTLVVESYLHGNGSEVYEAVEALKVGDAITVEAFLYWYNGAQPHINAITVAE